VIINVSSMSQATTLAVSAAMANSIYTNYGVWLGRALFSHVVSTQLLAAESRPDMCHDAFIINTRSVRKHALALNRLAARARANAQHS
jgi:hypothetical protein